jgi:hypothetical protein
MNIEELRGHINQLKAIAATDIDAIVSSSVRYTAQGAKNSAKQRLDIMEPQLVEAILSNSRVIIVRDDVTKKLDALATMKDVVTLDFLAFEKQIINTIFKDDSKPFVFDTHFQYQVNNLITDLFAQKVNVQAMESMAVSATEFGQVVDRAAAVNKLNDWMETTYEGELKSILLRHEMFEGARSNTAFDKINFLVTNVPESNVEGLMYSLGERLNGTAVLIGTEGSGLDAILVTEDTTDKELNTNLKKAFSKRGDQ